MQTPSRLRPGPATHATTTADTAFCRSPRSQPAPAGAATAPSRRRTGGGASIDRSGDRSSVVLDMAGSRRAVGAGEAAARALAGGRLGDRCELWPRRRAGHFPVDQHWSRPGRSRARRVGRSASRGEMPVAPGEQRQQDRPEVATALGQAIFVARRPRAVAVARQQSALDQRIEAPRQHVGRDFQALLEFRRSASARGRRRAGSGYSTIRRPAPGCGRPDIPCCRSSCAAMAAYGQSLIIMQVTERQIPAGDPRIPRKTARS